MNALAVSITVHRLDRRQGERQPSPSRTSEADAEAETPCALACRSGFIEMLAIPPRTQRTVR